jgi:hypothetical protein
MNWKERGRKLWWPDIWQLLSRLLACGTHENHDKPASIAVSGPRIEHGGFKTTKQQNYSPATFPDSSGCARWRRVWSCRLTPQCLQSRALRGLVCACAADRSLDRNSPVWRSFAEVSGCLEQCGIWDALVPCTLVDINIRFARSYCLCLQSTSLPH